MSVKPMTSLQLVRSHELNETGVITIAPRDWTIELLAMMDVKEMMPSEMFNDPPVYVWLPASGKEISVQLAINEYMNDEEIEVDDKMRAAGVERTVLKFDPSDDDQWK